MNHYPAELACQQKVEALVARSETQARDVFDLHLLLHRKIDRNQIYLKGKTQADRARSNALALSYETFKSQVVAYLESDEQPLYENPATWDEMVLTVTDFIEQLQDRQ